MADEFRVSLVAELKQKSLDSAIRNAKSDVPLKIDKFTINATSLAKQLQSELNKANLKVKIDGNFGKSGSTAKQINEITVTGSPRYEQSAAAVRNGGLRFSGISWQNIGERKCLCFENVWKAWER